MMHLSIWTLSSGSVVQPLATEPVAESAPAIADLSIIQSMVLGVVQGLTEFLPISSTAHIKVVPVALGWGDPGVAFTAFIQLGSILSILWYFWGDLSQVVVGTLRAIRTSNYDSTDFRIGLGILVGTIPIVIGGLALKILVPNFDNSPLRSMAAIAFASIVMSLLLAWAEYQGNRKRTYEDLSTRDGILMGLAQTLALMPGVSRSGSTLTAGLLIGLNRPAAARFSFLLGVPAITLAGVVGLRDLIDVGFEGTSIAALIAGFITATISSYLAIAWLLNFLKKHSTWVFVWYRLGFGVIILGSIWMGLVENR
ncbi:MAG TPA: undecaprenyl-diphosphate phosphatase [Candidatus Obscuribacterales bacterium]